MHKHTDHLSNPLRRFLLLTKSLIKMQLFYNLPEPIYFLFFVALWLFASAMMSQLSGWRELGKQFNLNKKIQGEVFRTVSGAVFMSTWRYARYSGVLYFTANQEGLKMSVAFPLRFMTPPLFIPWNHVESASLTGRAPFKGTTISLKNHKAKILILGDPGKRILEIYRSCLKPG